MKFEKEYSANEAASVMSSFMERYVDQAKIPGRILLWNSLKDGVKVVCRPFSQIAALDIFRGKILFVYDEREKTLRKIKWTEIVHVISNLEPWEENIDLLLFDESLDWFAAITHEDLLTLCAGTIRSKV